MKLFISSDIEGTCGICDWDETELTKPAYYNRFADQMTREVCAAARGAKDSGAAEEVVVKDAHDYARNIRFEDLPQYVTLIRGWVGGPCGMMAGAEHCDAVAMTGYHSCAFSDGNPLAHTMNTKNQWVRINGELASEFLINAYYAAYFKKPVMFLSGDETLCERAKQLIPNMVTVPVLKGMGGATVSIHPRLAEERIYEGIKQALAKDPASCMAPLPEHFEVEVQFKDYDRAKRGGFYPGAVQTDPKTIRFSHDDFYEAARFLYFTL